MTTPHYLLFSEASCSVSDQSWRFVIQDVDTSRRVAVSAGEPTTCGERLELLAVVRGLEALDGPARVTLVTRSRYVSRGIRFGIAEWRANDWQWERFGRVVPVKDCDLWQRVDRAMLFHRVECQAWQFEHIATGEPLSRRETTVGVFEVEADVLTRAASRCSETRPSPCEQPPIPRVASRLAPTKRRLGSRQPHGRKMGRCRGKSSLRSLTAAMVDKATSLGDTLGLLGLPVRRLVPGAA